MKFEESVMDWAIIGGLIGGLITTIVCDFEEREERQEKKTFNKSKPNLYYFMGSFGDSLK